MKNMLVAQSGGPSAAINATVAGVIDAGISSGEIENVYGALHGIKGVLNEDFVVLNEVCKEPATRDLLSVTPAAALGSCRWKLDDPSKNEEQFQNIINILRKNNIGYFIYTGGNDSMDTVYKLSLYCESHGIHDIKIMGAPKTIDNDLGETDHCPGFGSAAKFIATAFSEIACDSYVYDIPSVTIVEVMGRNAGWLTASAALARTEKRRVPQLIYLCERAFDVDVFEMDVRQALKENMNVIIAVSEGVKDAQGRYVGEETKSGKEDAFGHKYLSGIGKYLEGVVGERIGCKVRSVELNVLQRCAGYMLSNTDITESRNLGAYAAISAIRGESGKMSALKRLDTKDYQVEIELADLSKIANVEKKVPMEWITEDGHDIKEELVDYLRPLIQGEVNVPYENGVPKNFILE
ncbi:MAG: 6-phosphofructokinase [Anaerostipes sp.]|nr:6-phosphofructokinase [Anaerostipes sp.]